VLLGVLAASRRGSRLDTGISIGSLLGYSIPVFWFGQLLVALLAVRLGWLPAGGMTSAGEQLGGFERVLDVARHLILPSVTLGTLLMALVIRTTRAAMLDVLGDDYVMAARGRGLREEAVLLRHALRNALRPVITVITAELGVVLGVMVLVEAVFSWPGLGTLLLDSVLSRDTPTLVGLLLFSSFVVAAANLLGDLLYMWVDPRVRYT
jgi:peptide/nickel transport system permease protein